MKNQILKAAVVLGLLSVIGPFAIDMYLPTLPSIADHLSATTAQVQASLMSFMAAVALCQLVYGPVSDMIGRKPPLYFGMVLFVAGAIGCALSPSIEWLIAFRFIQGVGACASMALPRAIVRDGYRGADAAQLMSLLMLVFSISPILAPLTGSLVIQFGDWRTVFWVMAGAGVLGLLFTIVALKETRPPEARLESSVRGAFKSYGILLKDKTFLGLTFIGAFGMSSFMAYIGNSSFILIDHYGLTPTQYSFAFSVNAISFFGVSQSTGFMVKRFGLNRVVRTAVAGFAAAMVSLLVVFLLGVDRLDVLGSLMFVAFGFLGLVLPTTGVLAMEEHGEIAGTASAMLGTLQLVTGAVVMGVVGAFFNGTAMPMVVGFAACAVLAFLLTQVTIKSEQRAEVPAE
jgi:DHA1 family bicyclomycin/chloramphenicol resistance-like MFS transporter